MMQMLKTGHCKGLHWKHKALDGGEMGAYANGEVNRLKPQEELERKMRF